MKITAYYLEIKNIHNQRISSFIVYRTSSTMNKADCASIQHIVCFVHCLFTIMCISTHYSKLYSLISGNFSSNQRVAKSFSNKKTLLS